MKLAVVLCFAILIISAINGEDEDDNTDDKQKVTKLRDECFSETNVTKEMLKDYVVSRVATNEDKLDYTDTASSLACFMLCMLSKREFVDKEGTIEVDKLKENPDFVKFFTEKERSEKISDCLKKLEKVTSCDAALQWEQCFD